MRNVMSNILPTPLALASDDVTDAKLFADRLDMIRGLGCQPGGVIAEIGVAIGAMTSHLITTLQPKKFVGFDLFQLHTLESLWGHPSKYWFNELTHRQWYEQFLQEYSGVETIVCEGQSEETLQSWPDKFFDLIYVDADHEYEGVQKDATQAARGAVRKVVGIWCGAISDNTRVSFQAARSIG
jgi:hypothetical protein